MMLAFLLFQAQEAARRHDVGRPLSLNLQELEPKRKDASREVLLVDGDNVRGKADWLWSSAEVTAFAATLPLSLILFLDHGERREARRIGPRAVLAFPGPFGTADDAIVDTVEWVFQRTNRTVKVCTSDYGLRHRLNFIAAREQRKELTITKKVSYVQASAFVRVLTEQRIKGPFLEPFDAAHRELAVHVRGRPRPNKKNNVKEALIAREQTWMRVVLAEKLRRLLQQRSSMTTTTTTKMKNDDDLFDDEVLPTFAAAYTDGFADEYAAFDMEKRLLLHPLSSRRQRHELLKFADGLLLKSTTTQNDGNNGTTTGDDVVGQDQQEQQQLQEGAPSPLTSEPLVLAEEDEFVRRGVQYVRPSTRRERRKRARRLKGLVVTKAPPRKQDAVKVLLAKREVLEDAMSDWLSPPS
mmetsp:Transcript_29993/g.96780  ORF Transcript_29993/g.96780 Transcript_29993/m.96780 type:complete len:411 (+) Transcript_29993:101-1333(+)|eukprot:CAMPEP_0118901990 /NCGR_PEP_ID=MMETSP1166-20130328/7473_1 /TAXON_ID=1104430 /ORGANISM="Chrysoreinhardia sp, Strain CCMP3193" /LENGTH=410 /DNA_ID=CAMNT_0006841185 /DNA_START=8 /DNA_END=1240 /DNA_ORIENTATION=+